MNILLVMIPLSILLALGAGVAFFWAVDHDQFDDLDTPKLLPLLDNPLPAERHAGNRPGNRRNAASSNVAAAKPRRRGNELRELFSLRPSALGHRHDEVVRRPDSEDEPGA
jgi:cbb3-type cytochrome oxidase maturation protein